MINEKIESINELAITLYKEAIKTDNKLMEKNSLEIIKDINFISEIYNNKTIESVDNSNENEIKKVKRKVPLWMKRQHQYNYIILEAYMRVSNYDETPILLTLLEKKSKLDSVLFYRHYNLMKNIFEKNHAKVFSETDGIVSLWEPISDYLIETFKNHEK